MLVPKRVKTPSNLWKCGEAKEVPVSTVSFTTSHWSLTNEAACIAMTGGETVAKFDHSTTTAKARCSVWSGKGAPEGSTTTRQRCLNAGIWRDCTKRRPTVTPSVKQIRKRCRIRRRHEPNEVLSIKELKLSRRTSAKTNWKELFEFAPCCHQLEQIFVWKKETTFKQSNLRK